MVNGSDRVYDRSLEDVGNIVEFGHVNLRVSDQQQAVLFYVVGLGLTRDPHMKVGLENAWINVGGAQFHLPTGPAQTLQGVTGLVMPDLDALIERLLTIKTSLSGTRFSFVRTNAGVEVVCPWGNRFRVHSPDRERFGVLALGIPYVEFHTSVGTSARIADFYVQILGTAADMGEDAEGVFARIPAGLTTNLFFREVDRDLAAFDGHHIQITVADFSGVHRRLKERGLVTEESNQSQYRFQNIVDLARGDVLVALEHEVRSMRHPMYARALVNRTPTPKG